MKNYYSNLRPGFIVKRVYPVIADYLGDSQMPFEDPEKYFLNTQPINVLELLRREARKFKNITPTKDPIEKDFIRTQHPKIFLTVPKGIRTREGMTPIFYSCPHCGGRLFWGMPVCGWCGTSVANKIKIEEGSADSFLNLIDYLYPQSPRPSIAPILSALTKPNDSIIVEEEIDPTEFKLLLRNIEDFIPSTAKTR